MENLAPWAEPVLTSAEELWRLPDDGWRYEVVEGRLVRMAPTGGRHGRIVMALLRAVDRFVEERHLGAVFPAETGFLISSAGGIDTVLAPDLAFIRTKRIESPVSVGYLRTVPDLVVEVVSPSQSRLEMGAKAQRWLSAGVPLVWIVLPETGAVEVWRGDGSMREVTAEEQLSGEDILPGFTVPVTELFP